MEPGRALFLSCGHSPRACLPFSLITLTLAIAAGLGTIACSSGESVSPDIPAAFTRDAAQGGRDILDTQARLRVRIAGPRGEDGGRETRAQDWWLIRRLDIFIFEDDGLGTLDAYIREDRDSPSEVEIHCAGGDKVVVAVANARFTEETVTGILCYEDLRKIVACLTEDLPQYPLMSGETSFAAGTGRDCEIVLEPMMSVVELKSLRFRMPGARLTDVRVYLTGVSNRAELLRPAGFLPSETLNNGGLSETDLGRLPYSGMVYSYLGNGKEEGDGTVYPGASLYCYPNQAREESFASPFTRLVVEGLLDGKRCCYPIPVNRDLYGSGKDGGIGRNSRYVYELTLTRAGTESPDDITLFGP